MRVSLDYVTSTKETIGHGVRSLHTPPDYRGLKDVFKNVYREGGMCALYRGVGPTLVEIFPYAGLKFYMSRNSKDILKSTRILLCCAYHVELLAGLFGHTFTCPPDDVRGQMQVQSLQKGGPGYRNTIEGFTTIIRNEGWGQLFAGLSINYMKASASLFSIFFDGS